MGRHGKSAQERSTKRSIGNKGILNRAKIARPRDTYEMVRGEVVGSDFFNFLGLIDKHNRKMTIGFSVFSLAPPFAHRAR